MLSSCSVKAQHVKRHLKKKTQICTQCSYLFDTQHKAQVKSNNASYDRGRTGGERHPAGPFLPVHSSPGFQIQILPIPLSLSIAPCHVIDYYHYAYLVFLFFFSELSRTDDRSEKKKKEHNNLKNSVRKKIPQRERETKKRRKKKH